MHDSFWLAPHSVLSHLPYSETQLAGIFATLPYYQQPAHHKITMSDNEEVRPVFSISPPSVNLPRLMPSSFLPDFLRLYLLFYIFISSLFIALPFTHLHHLSKQKLTLIAGIWRQL